jgi:general secretion pathway protein M
MSPRISPPLRRIAAFALLLAAAGALVFGVIQPLIETYADAKATVVRERAAMERARITGLDTAVLQAELARLKQRQTSATGLVPATNESLAAAQLQDRLKSTLEAAHGELRSTQILPARTEGRYRRVTIRAQAAARITALQHVLYSLESAPPFLFLDNVEIRARPDQSGRSGAAEDPNLEIRLDLFGYMRAAP